MTPDEYAALAAAAAALAVGTAIVVSVIKQENRRERRYREWMRAERDESVAARDISAPAGVHGESSGRVDQLDDLLDDVVAGIVERFDAALDGHLERHGRMEPHAQMLTINVSGSDPESMAAAIEDLIKHRREHANVPVFAADCGAAFDTQGPHDDSSSVGPDGPTPGDEPTVEDDPGTSRFDDSGRGVSGLGDAQ